MARRVKKDPDRCSEEDASAPEQNRDETLERRVLRSRYLAVKNQIVDGKEDLTRVDSDRFKSIITEVEALHHQVQKPREQIADAEALLDITSTLASSIRSQGNKGLTPSDFVTAILRKFGQRDATDNGISCKDAFWKDLGAGVAHVFMRPPGCSTMMGPMNMEPKHRKAPVHRKHSRPTESTRPEELEGSNSKEDERTDTDKNMLTMFEILRKRRRVQLESLILNPASFAQTVENLFALSFLTKDGRAEITVDDDGQHIVVPRNAPAASAVAGGEVSYSHFVFRLDYKDWMLMKERASDQELMPHRSNSGSVGASGSESMMLSAPEEGAGPLPRTPIRKLTRNRGLVVQDELVVEDSPEEGSGNGRGRMRKKVKRLLG